MWYKKSVASDTLPYATLNWRFLKNWRKEKMKKRKNKKQEDSFNLTHYSILSNIIYFIKLFKKYEPVVLVCAVVEIIFGTLIPLVGIYLPKIAMDIVIEGVTGAKAIITLSLITITIMLLYSINTAVRDGKYHLYNMQRSNIMAHIFLKSLKIKYEYVEAGDVKKAYWKACNANTSGDWSASSRMVTDTITLVKNLLCFILYSTVLSSLSIWVVLVLIGLSFLSYLISMSQIKFIESMRDEEARINKKYWCLKSSMGDVAAAKDIRIFGMNKWLVKLRDEVLEDMKKIARKRSKKNEQCEKLGFLLTMIRDLAAYGYLLYQIAGGDITVSEFVLYFGAVTGFSGFIMSIMNNIASLRQAANETDYIRAYMDIPDEDRETGNRHIDELKMPVKIEFKDVCFSYKQAGEDENEEDTKKDKESRLIFNHFNLTINQGEKIALVGVNGAGKTTFVKLLCGMYEPDEGKILINGIDRNEFSKNELYKLFSVVFQEILVLPFTVGENIALDVAENVDEKRAWEALDKAGLKKVFEEKDIKMDSFMKKYVVESGIELSGGQQQRFLLARALYKDAPILVLDEPTAALDPIAESEVYESYNKYSKDKTAIFISHRLASTRFSDKIVFIEDGQVVEMGTHDELMEKDGAYAEMFKIQSSYYDDSNNGKEVCI